jgi:hypothetical protein
MKLLKVWVAASLALLLGPVLLAQAPFPPGFDGELYFAARIDLVPAAEGGPYTVTLDGSLNDPVWQRAAFQTVNTFLDSGQPAEIDPATDDWDMIFATCADPDYLYIAWKIVDDTLVVNEQTACNVWQDDSIEVYIDALNNGPNCTEATTSCYAADDIQITVGADQIGREPGNPEQLDCPDGTPVEECLKFGGVGAAGACDFGPPAPEVAKGVVVELEVGDLTGPNADFGEGKAGWQGEIAIALNTLGNANDGTPMWEITPDSQACIGFSMQGNDDDGAAILDRDHKLAWAKREVAESAWRNPGVFGKLTFFDPTKPVSQGACALPVERLTCARDGDGTVVVTWTNPGTANPAIPTRIQVDGTEVTTVAGDAVSARLTEAQVPIDGVDHIITVINNSDETPPSCTIVQSPFTPCGAIRFWNVLGGFGQPYGAAPTVEQIRLDYMTDGVTGELDFKWQLGAQIQTDLSNPADPTEPHAAASTSVERGILNSPAKNPGTPPVPTVFTWTDVDGRVDYNPVFRRDVNDVMAYSQCYVINNSGEPKEVYIGITSDDSVQVFLNGNEVWINSIGRPASDMCTPLDITPDGLNYLDPHILEPGQNSVMMKVFDGTQSWEFGLRFQDAAGTPITEDLEISLVPTVTEPTFVRGDADANGSINITDGIFLLNALFSGGTAPTCRDAADSDDSGALNITDGIFLLNWLFAGGRKPPEPAPPGGSYTPGDCGPDPTPDETECAGFAPCA